MEQQVAIQEDIEKIRNQYTSVSQLASIIFFVIQDLALIDSMYQYSLQYIRKLFIFAIERTE